MSLKRPGSHSHTDPIHCVINHTGRGTTPACQAGKSPGRYCKAHQQCKLFKLVLPSSEMQFSPSWVRIQMHFCMHFGLVCSAGSKPPEEKQTKSMAAGNWHFPCLNAALQRKTEQSGRTASPQLLQSVHLFMASCWNSPAPLMGNKRKYKRKYLHPSSKRFCYSSTRDNTSAVKLETSSHMCSLESAKASLPKTRLPWRCVHELPSWTSPLPAPTEAVIIRRLLANTIPPEGF